MNSITITGRVTTDPQLRELPSGDHACQLRLAVDGMARGRETGYVNVTAYGKPAQAAARVLTKGWLVAVDGRLEYGEWDQDGTRRHDYQIVGNVEFLTAPRTNGENAETPAQEVAA